MLKFIVLFFVFAAVAQGEDAPKPAEDVPAASADTEAVIDEEAVDEDLPEEYADDGDYEDDLDMTDDGMADEDMEDMPMDEDVAAGAEVPATPVEGAVPEAAVEEPKPVVPSA